MAENSADAALARRLERHLAGAGLQVAVEASDDTLVLNGVVESEESRQAASDIATYVAPNTKIDNQLEVVSILPTDIDDFQSSGPRAELDDSADEILASGGETEPDFIDRPGISDALEAAGPIGSVAEDVASSGDVYTPPIDPVVTSDAHGVAQVLGGFEIDAEDDLSVEPSAGDRHPGDEALADAVRRELAEDAATTDLNIFVAVRNGVAHLRGQVNDLDDVDNAEAVASRIPGIREVVEELEVVGL